MAKGTEIKEVVDHINSSFAIDWRAEAAHIAQHVANDLLNLEFDSHSTPVKVVTYYSLCDCGAPVLERIEIQDEPFLLVWTEYMETCYECMVVSSD